MRRLIVVAVVFMSIYAPSEAAEVYDLVIYGGNSAALIAAVQSVKMDKTVVVVSPDVHLGGLTSSGLGYTDTGNKAVIGGLARSFYHEVWKKYQEEDTWRWQSREEFGNRGQGVPAMDGEFRTMWVFEPHVAEQVFEEMIATYKIPVHRNEWLDREKGVKMEGNRIVSLSTLSGKRYYGKRFIDATYEGDLMAAAGVSYTVGRESNAVYDETLNGVQVQNAVSHQFEDCIDPYRVPGDPDSGLLPRIHDKDPGTDGEADQRLQAYNYRVCLTQRPDNRVPFPKPEGYDPLEYELLGRCIDAGYREMFGKFDMLPNLKTDTNNRGAFSTDNIGMNYDYPVASYERRREILREHEAYQKGYFWFLANDPRVAQDVRDEMSQWGLAKDEFADNGHWPYQIYVRESRRMVSDFVVSERHLRRMQETPCSVGMGSYNMDSHNTQRYVAYDEKGRACAKNEGDVQINPGGPYPIDYGAMVPRESECANLLVPVCVSSSHIAFGSIRMEPVFMILGQSAATAAVLSLEADESVQNLDYEKLAARLLPDGQILEMEMDGKTNIDAATLPGIVKDNTQAELQGTWLFSTAVPGMVGFNYIQHTQQNKEEAEALYTLAVPRRGRYEVRLSYTPHENRATNTLIAISGEEDAAEVYLNQREDPGDHKPFKSLGTYLFEEQAVIRISNKGADGVVIADAVQLLPVEE
ncbi:MAG: FAD-dependent oxidoreductase [Candidatus Hydrogenedentes bacterium]|nr:FAD-dependent oxidoreductase [Candidatus Hydrogenedentota bacterium]